MARFFRHIEITMNDALALRELVRPFDSNLSEPAKVSLAELAIKIYAALIELERDEIESINIAVDETECLILNYKIGNEDWKGAVALLRQSWAVLYEIKNDMPPGTSFALDDILKSMSAEHADDKPEAATP